jgi:hypothetical protein
MNIKKTVAVALSMAVLGTAFASSAKADEWNKLTYLTFSKDVAIPGKVLTAGTYVFRLSDSASDRHIVQIFDQTGAIISTLLTVVDHRLSSTGDTVITFGESAGNIPPPIMRWFYPGDTDGEEFVYWNSSAVTP